jgi:hypothetical protein
MKTTKAIQNRISKIRQALLDVGDMHPGSLSEQYNVCGSPGCHCKDKENPKKHGPYYQLSFVHRKRSGTRFIKPDDVIRIKKQIVNYKKFKALTDEWRELTMDLEKLKMAEAKTKGK